MPARRAPRTSDVYVEAVPERCLCHWRNYADHDGWYLVEYRTDCPMHGHQRTGCAT